jgi:hypothetical protein
VTDVPIYHKRPAIATFVRAYVANKQISTAKVRGFGNQYVCVWKGASLLAELILIVFKFKLFLRVVARRLDETATGKRIRREH